MDHSKGGYTPATSFGAAVLREPLQSEGALRNGFTYRTPSMDGGQKLNETALYIVIASPSLSVPHRLLNRAFKLSIRNRLEKDSVRMIEMYACNRRRLLGTRHEDYA